MSQAMSVQGIIARHAADVRLATSVMIQPDPRDPLSPPIPWNGPDVGGLPTVAMTTESAGYDIHPDIVALVQRAADQLRDAGYTVVEVEPPPIIESAREWFRAGTTEMEATLDPILQMIEMTDQLAQDDVPNVQSLLSKAQVARGDQDRIPLLVKAQAHQQHIEEVLKQLLLRLLCLNEMAFKLPVEASSAHHTADAGSYPS
mgnify:CR=1 FL=1